MKNLQYIWIVVLCLTSVSYTHLDVYKRQPLCVLAQEFLENVTIQYKNLIVT